MKTEAKGHPCPDCNGTGLLEPFESQVSCPTCCGSGELAPDSLEEQDGDIHRTTAAQVFGVEPSQVTAEMRRVAKSINFGISYGMSGYGMAWRTGLSQKEADRFIKEYFTKYSRVKAYLDETKRKARDVGYVETLLGRRRYFPELRSGSRAHQNVRASAQRMAINAPIQGSAADIIKKALRRAR